MSATLHPDPGLLATGVVHVDELKARLLARARELMAQDAVLRERLASQQSVTTNTFVAGTEGACATEADDEVIALLRHEQDELRAVQDALTRLAEGRFAAVASAWPSTGQGTRLRARPRGARFRR